MVHFTPQLWAGGNKRSHKDFNEAISRFGPEGSLANILVGFSLFPPAQGKLPKADLWAGFWQISVSVAPAIFFGLAPPDLRQAVQRAGDSGSNACLATARTVVLSGHDFRCGGLEKVLGAACNNARSVHPFSLI